MTTFKISTSPKNVGIAFGFYRLPLLDGFLAHFGILSLFLSHFPISTDPPNKKWLATDRLWVYRFEEEQSCGSQDHPTTALQSTKPKSIFSVQTNLHSIPPGILNFQSSCQSPQSHTLTSHGRKHHLI